jgi:hypothetical protein
MDLERRNEMAAPAFDFDLVLRASGAACCRQRRMARCAIRRQEWWTLGRLKAPHCSKLKALVLNLFSHYVLFDRKSEVYDVRGSGALSGQVRG